MAKPKVEKKPQVNIQKLIQEYWEVLDNETDTIPPRHMRHGRKGSR